MIMHIDMDAFFASIEQAINPKLKGKPLIVGSRDNKLHTVVCAASYEAKAYGIDSGMPSKDAFRLCPHLEFVASDQSKYIWTSEQILEMLKLFGFEVVYASIDEFQMDIADKAEPQTLAQTIQNQVDKNFNLTASIGIAKNCLLAKLASKLNKPNGLVLINETNLSEILSKIPVEKLCGIGKSTGKILENLGVKTCLELYQKSPQFLEQNLGKPGLDLYLSLHSTDSFPAGEKDLTIKSISHSYTLPKALENPQFIRAWIRLLSEMVARRLRQNNLLSRTVHFWLSSPEIAYFAAQRTFQQPSNDGYEIYQRALKIRLKIGQKMAKIRALGISCSNLTQSDYPALFKEQERRQALIRALDRINLRYGEETIYPAIIKLIQNKT